IVRLPALQTLAVGGEEFVDAHLARLAETSTLRWLVLDSTDATPEAIGSLRHSRPDLAVYETERLAIAAIPTNGYTSRKTSWPNELIDQLNGKYAWETVRNYAIVGSRRRLLVARA